MAAAVLLAFCELSMNDETRISIRRNPTRRQRGGEKKVRPNLCVTTRREIKKRIKPSREASPARDFRRRSAR